MSAEEGHFFEGTEKLLELWFGNTEDESKAKGDLRIIERSKWVSLLNHVNCEIISIKSDSSMVAYLLSESSMFVSKHRIILKTCGKTTLLVALQPLIALAKDECGLCVADIFYSRKNYTRPDLQHVHHQTFEKEVAILDKAFENGAAYALGRINKDCWYLYTVDDVGVDQPDQTLELIMQDLDEEKMKAFSKEFAADGADSTKKSGIDRIIPGTIIDDYLFDPCGYSMNGILPDGHYFTIHITPEPDFSYVSFETNVPKESYHEIIARVLEIFKPGKFLMTLFTNSGSKARGYHDKLVDLEDIEGYRRMDHQTSQLKNYNLMYTMYKNPTVEETSPK